MNLSCKGHRSWKNKKTAAYSSIPAGVDGLAARCRPLLLDMESHTLSFKTENHRTQSWFELQLFFFWMFWSDFDWFFFSSSSLFSGDVHVGMLDRGGQLEVEVNQARGLIPKSGSKNIPGTHLICESCFTKHVTQGDHSFLSADFLFQQPTSRCMSWRTEYAWPRRKPK